MNSSSNSRRNFLKKTAFGAVLAGSTNALPVEKSIETRLTKAYGLSVPIVSAGMAFVASADLAIAVSKSGGLGQMSGSGFPVDYLKSQIIKIKNAVG